MDEKWAFVGKKQKNCDDNNPDDARLGDHWDHISYDPENRLVLSVVSGKRTKENTEKLVQDTKKRLNNRVPRLITTDDYKPYKDAILNAYHTEVKPAKTGKPGRPRKAKKEPLAQLNYATVCKQRKKGKVLKVSTKVVFGVAATVNAALTTSKVSQRVNTSFLERQNGTDRHFNSRKRRKTYGFSKDWDVHKWVSYFTLYSYNFCWPVRTLRFREAAGRYQNQTPAMSAGLTDHVWSLSEWLFLPSIRHTAKAGH
jgi:IS1 family transposase